MVLSDQHIQEAIRDGRLKIDPLPELKAYDTMSVDLRLGSQFFSWNLDQLTPLLGEAPTIDLSNYDFSRLSKAYLQPITPDRHGSVLIEQGQFLLSTTLERVGFPGQGRLAGRVEGKSSLARLGLSVHFAPTLHSTWEGLITLELHNVGPAPLRLKPGVPICQLIVEEVSGEPTSTMADSRFQGQTTPQG